MVLAGIIDCPLIVQRDSIIVAVDGGYNFCVANDIEPTIVIGDLDSVIGEISTNVLKLNPVKDDTDFAVALQYVLSNYPDMSIDVYGFASLSRIDHVLTNLAIIQPGIQFITKNQRVNCYQSSFSVTKSEFTYISFFGLTNVDNLNLSGFKYNVNNYDLTPFDPLFVSNELNDNQGYVEFNNGKLIVIESINN